MSGPKLMGNGEGHTVLILTGADSLLLRNYLTVHGAHVELAAYNRGVQRGTCRIKAEFDAEQKARKVSASSSRP